MAYDTNAGWHDPDHVDVDDALDMMSPIQSGHHSGTFGRDRPPHLNEQYSRRTDSLEQPLFAHQYYGHGTIEPFMETTDVSGFRPATHDGNESSLDSSSTAQGITVPIRPHVLHILAGDIVSPQSTTPTGLTYHAVATLQFHNSLAYSGNTNDWVQSGAALPALNYNAHNADEAGPDGSLALAPRSNVGSYSNLSNSSYVYVNLDEAKAHDKTAAIVSDAGRWSDDVSASPLDIDQLLGQDFY